MSKKKTAHLLKLKKEYLDAIQAVESNEGAKYKKYKALIAKDCFHPEVISFSEEVDDGYGQFWTVQVSKCSICGKIIKREF